jgi:ACS family tartrate transporter-like MFS transporter
MAERRWNLFWACIVAAAGLTIAAQTVGTAWALVGKLVLDHAPMILTGTAAASAIAWINSVGNLGGFFGPSVVGWAKDYSGSFAGGLYALAGFALLSAIVSALWLSIPNPAARQEMARVPAE